VQEHLAQRGITPGAAPPFPPRLSLEKKAPVPDGEGVALEGRFSRALDLETLAGRSRALGKARLDGETLRLGEWAELFRDGRVLVRGTDEADLVRRVEALAEAVARSEEGAGCGICTGRCKTGAASIRKGRMVIDPEKCTQCGACLKGPGPATAYGPEEL
jgi:ferredoxin